MGTKKTYGRYGSYPKLTDDTATAFCNFFDCMRGAWIVVAGERANGEEIASFKSYTDAKQYTKQRNDTAKGKP